MADNEANLIVILGTGGTIAGAANTPGDQSDYKAGEIGIEQLIAAVPGLGDLPLLAEQVAQIDSKDLDFSLWQKLAARCAHWLAQSQVRGIVITHGTDTVEETAFFLSQILPAVKPVVLTCAMLPATAPGADGPRNLQDAVTVARDPGAAGVVVVCAGAVHSANDVRKAHPSRLDAFSSAAAGPLARVDDGSVVWLRKMPLPLAHGSFATIEKIVNAPLWPRVEIVLNHAGADGFVVRALIASGVDGIVAAGTGNGTLHEELEAALLAAQQGGVRVVRATRCFDGAVRPRAGDPFEPAGELSPVKARIALMLDLLGQGSGASVAAH